MRGCCGRGELQPAASAVSGTQSGMCSLNSKCQREVEVSEKLAGNVSLTQAGWEHAAVGAARGGKHALLPMYHCPTLCLIDADIHLPHSYTHIHTKVPAPCPALPCSRCSLPAPPPVSLPALPLHLSACLPPSPAPRPQVEKEKVARAQQERVVRAPSPDRSASILCTVLCPIQQQPTPHIHTLAHSGSAPPSIAVAPFPSLYSSAPCPFHSARGRYLLILPLCLNPGQSRYSPCPCPRCMHACQVYLSVSGRCHGPALLRCSSCAMLCCVQGEVTLALTRQVLPAQPPSPPQPQPEPGPLSGCSVPHLYVLSIPSCCPRWGSGAGTPAPC